ncbi:S1C family serine protease [Alteribacillus bidgolensis]|uniref:HtrA-like peptidase. Serine peptidase. MEROPS family S01B n=1 Tax=Alteribacillus bidgolensis TaxID=930129 RepID=A0A1G8QKM5_9BACI|nr:trypsin-like peptidase domain-containing protein [Alteribacillus bidgolensis]SDJ05218.1 htrA-like peptidase. Serine peptidase. MEROPS family S01B [Alteribacillus bidgolensis]
MDDKIKPEKNNQNKKAGITGLIGAVIGAAAVGITMPFVNSEGLLSTASSNSQEQSSEAEMEVKEMTSESVEVSSGVTSAVEQVSDAVVGIFNLQQSGGMEPQGSGSGVIYKKEGDTAYIVTNHHVVQESNEIEVGLANEERVEAEVVGSDPLTDLAVLSIDAEHVDTVAEFGNSKTLSAGEPAIAIGNPLGSNLDGTVTQGIISAVDRSIPVDLNGDEQIDWNADVLQTDAAINPGNSGGALINIKGQVIGINSMKIAQSAVEGIGFATPSNVVIPVLEDLEETGQVARPQLGVTIGSLDQIPSVQWEKTLKLPKDVEEGVFVNSVASGSPAEKAGLQQYDVITAINDENITDGNALRNILYKEVEVGETIKITFYRNGEQQTTELTLGESGETQT